MNQLIKLVHYFRKYPALQIFTIYLRYLIGGAFVMAAIGMGKLSPNSSFLQAPEAQSLDEMGPIQLFFHVMVESGLYWNFIGWSQIIAGFLLMSQRFASLGAAIFFGLILNIFVITVSYGFKGTPIVTGLMLLAAIFLLLWDIEKWQFLFRPYTHENLPPTQKLNIIGTRYWELLGLILFAMIFVFFLARLNIGIQLIASVGIGFIGFALFFVLKRRGVS